MATVLRSAQVDDHGRQPVLVASAAPRSTSSTLLASTSSYKSADVNCPLYVDVFSNLSTRHREPLELDK